MRPEAGGSDFVCARLDGAPLTGDGVCRLFLRAKGRCEKLHASKAGLTFHDLRHTAASLMVGAGVPLFDVAEILGTRHWR